MKKINIYVICLVLAIFSQISFSQEPDVQQLRDNAFKLYQQRKFDEALQILQQIVEIKEKKSGSQDVEVARALYDMAIVKLAASDEKNGGIILRKVTTIFQAKNDLKTEDSVLYAKALEMLGYIRFKDKDKKEAVDFYQRALNLKEKYSGSDSIETSKTLWGLANIYFSMGDNQKAKEYYERVVKIRTNNLGQVAYDDAYDALNRYDCTSNRAGTDSLSEQFSSDSEAKIKEHYKKTIFNAGVINSKATNLIRPRYPSDQNLRKLGGFVNVMVVIDETGNVIFACAKSGNPGFWDVAEKAALASNFSATLVNGIPVKVSGTIVYRFIP